MKKTITLTCLSSIILLGACSLKPETKTEPEHQLNSPYSGKYLERLAFPMGGIGTGMICMEGNGAISHFSVRNVPDVFNEPFMFGAIAVKGLKNGAKILEGPLPKHKIFGTPHSGNGNSNSKYGYPRFEQAIFTARFPFGNVSLRDEDIPLDVEITGWSPLSRAMRIIHPCRWLPLNTLLQIRPTLHWRWSSAIIRRIPCASKKKTHLEQVIPYRATRFKRLRMDSSYPSPVFQTSPITKVTFQSLHWRMPWWITDGSGVDGTIPLPRYGTTLRT